MRTQSTSSAPEADRPNAHSHDPSDEHAIPGTAEWSNLSVDQIRRAGGCEHPIQLRGEQWRDDTPMWSTDHLPGGIAYVACKTRRANVCAPCARLYQGDAFQLIVAGLRGGKSVPESVCSHPALFVTLTAPAFGPVHGQRDGAPCRPRRDGESCPHGRSLACHTKHIDSDPLVGQPLCVDCFDYNSAVLWNAHAGALWRVTRIAIDRTLARLAGMSAKDARCLVRTQYVKVAEFQKRGLVHFHLAIRLDGVEGPQPPPFTLGLLREAIAEAAKNATVTTPAGRFGWGCQIDLAEITADEHENETTRGKVAGYLAKYSTKGSDAVGALDKRLSKESEVDYLRVNSHLARMVRTSWQLARRYPELRGDRWAHQLGFRGHFLTKSRAWSTTFRTLRQARANHQAEIRDKSWNVLNDNARAAIEARWQYVASGYRTQGDAWVAEMVRNQRVPRKVA